MSLWQNSQKDGQKSGKYLKINKTVRNVANDSEMSEMSQILDKTTEIPQFLDKMAEVSKVYDVPCESGCRCVNGVSVGVLAVSVLTIFDEFSDKFTEFADFR